VHTRYTGHTGHIRYAQQKEKSLIIVISASSSEPMYKQITDQMKEAIANGSLAPETRLPSIRELSRELKVSTITIKRAYSDLGNEGYIITRIGLGSFVAGMSRDKLRQQKIAEIRKEIEKIVVTAEKIGISARDVGDIVGEIGKGNNKKEACNDTV